MEIFGYAWFIYVLTILLLISIFFIIVLILVKCVQTIIHARIFCCKRPNQRHRPGCSRQRRRRETNHSNNSPAMAHSASSDSSCSCSYISTSCSSSDDSDSESYVNSNNSNNNNNNRNKRVWHAYDNIGFSTSYELNLDLNENSIRNSNIINRKYDDLNRFNKKSNNVKKEIKNKNLIKSNDLPYHQISIIPTKCSYLAITKNNNNNNNNSSKNEISDFIHSCSTGSNKSKFASSNRSYTINTCSYILKKSPNPRSFFKNKSFNESKIYEDVTNLFDPIMVNLTDNQQINRCIFGNRSQDESLSINSEIDDEIPPPYSQVIRESTV